jgi:thioredoxin reductase (NADPH)
MPAEPQVESVRLLVIGGGPAGYTAAMYGARFGLEPVCLEGFDAGGQISRSYLVENFPGIADGMTGADLSARIRAQAESFGARMVTDDVVSVDLGQRPFTVTAHFGTYRADAVVVATGSRPRELGLPGEEEFVGRGIAYCAICDGAFFAGSRVAVVGGGNAALGEAMAMSRLASQVTLLHRRTTFRADAAVESAMRAAGDVDVVAPVVVEELVPGDDGALAGLRLRDLDDGSTRYLATDGLFIAIGHIPASAPFADWLRLDDAGGIVTSPLSTATSVEGVFAAGDVADARYRQAVTAAASGCQAAIDVERWLVTGEWLGVPATPEPAAVP